MAFHLPRTAIPPPLATLCRRARWITRLHDTLRPGQRAGSAFSLLVACGLVAAVLAVSVGTGSRGPDTSSTRDTPNAAAPAAVTVQPALAAVPLEATAGALYVVRPADTCDRILVAAGFFYSELVRAREALAAANPGLPAGCANPGFVLRVPRGRDLAVNAAWPGKGALPTPPIAGARYTFASGDSCAAILRRAGVADDDLDLAVRRLAELNGWLAIHPNADRGCAALRTGDTAILPSPGAL